MIDKPASTDPQSPEAASRPSNRGQKGGSTTIGADTVLDGNISGGGEIVVDGTVKGDVRIDQVTVGSGGGVEGGIYAEVVEVRGRVMGSITAKQVRLYDACHVDGDITHEQLAMESGAFFQGRSLRLQRASRTEAAATPAGPSATEPVAKPAPADAAPKPAPTDAAAKPAPTDPAAKPADAPGSLFSRGRSGS